MTVVETRDGMETNQIQNLNLKQLLTLTGTDTGTVC